MSAVPQGKPCALHNGSRTCDCHGPNYAPRADPTKKGIWTLVRGIWTSPDGRQKRTPAQIRERKKYLLETHPFCAACGETFTNYRQVQLAHIHGKGLGGAFRDDSDKNTLLMHERANLIQGGMDLAAYLKIWKPEHCQ